MQRCITVNADTPMNPLTHRQTVLIVITVTSIANFLCSFVSVLNNFHISEEYCLMGRGLLLVCPLDLLFDPKDTGIGLL
jgi:hypothetical protein